MESKILEIVKLALRVPNAQVSINTSINQVNVYAFPRDKNGDIPINSSYLFNCRGYWAGWAKDSDRSLDSVIKKLTDYI